MAEPLRKKADIISPSDFKYTKPLREVMHPETAIIWEQAVAAARRGEYKTRAEGCPHPMNLMEQYQDDMNYADRDFGEYTNLFNCGLCGSVLRLVDPHGLSASDGDGMRMRA